MVALRNVGCSQATLGMHERSIGLKTKGGWIEKEEHVMNSNLERLSFK